jgi:hypothetical protein
VAGARLRVITGQLVAAGAPADPLGFQAECVEAFVASWTARGFAASTIGNDAGLLERMLAALDRPAWEVTAEDVDRVVGELAAAGRAVSTRRNYLQVFRGFHRFLEVRKAAEIEAAFGIRLTCPVDEFNSARHVSDDSPAQEPVRRWLRTYGGRNRGGRSGSLNRLLRISVAHRLKSPPGPRRTAGGGSASPGAVVLHLRSCAGQ